MSFDPEFLELMTQEVVIARYTGEDSYGNNTYDTAFLYRCRIDTYNNASGGGPWRGGTVATPTRVTTNVILQYVTPVFTVRDKVTLPDGRTPTITNVAVEYDEDGPHHIVLSCEETRE